MSNPLLKIDGLKTYFHTEDGTVRAVDGVSLVVERGKTLGIVGESGSGKSVTAYSILRLLPESIADIKEGVVEWIGEKGRVDLAKLPIEEMPHYRGGDIAMIFQEPMTSLNPVFKCGKQVAESIVYHKGASWEEAWKRATELLDAVKIPRPALFRNQYPH